MLSISSIIFAFIIFVSIKHLISEKIICDKSYNKKLTENEIIFFQSQQFPLLIDKNILNQCSINVTGNSVKTNMYLILVITNGYITNGKVKRRDNDIREITKENIYFFTPGQALTFYFSPSSVSNGAEAFQGFVTYEDRSPNRCLLSGKKEPYQFQDEFEIYYLRSNLDGLKETSRYQHRRCLWRFNSLPGYGIKIDILGINYYTTKLYVVTDNTREYIISFSPSIKYYNTTKAAISYDDKHGAFEAKVSIFKLSKSVTDDGCICDNSTLLWKINPKLGYGHSIHCWKNIEIPPNHELKVTVSKYIFNETGNFLQFYTDDDRFFPLNITQNKDYIFLPHYNNTIRNLSFEFKNDDSVVNRGMEIKYELIECKCPPEKLVVPCSENVSSSFSMLGREDHFYCARRKCTIEISTNKSCPNNHIFIEANFGNVQNRDDNFTIWDEDEILISHRTTLSLIHKSLKATILPYRKTFMFFKSTYDSSVDYLESPEFTLTLTPFKVYSGMTPANVSSSHLKNSASNELSLSFAATSPKPNTNVNLLPFAIILGSLVFLSVIVLIFICWFYKNKKRLRKNRTIMQSANNSYLHLLKPSKPSYFDSFIDAQKILILNELGSGCGGIVSLAEYRTENEIKKVAVKALRCSKADVIKEIQALSSCSHENIVSFIGWTDIEDEMCIITEYMIGGELHSYLVKPANVLTVSTIFSYIFQVLDAMIYLSEKHILHRDLAARNCLLNDTYEILKLSDFGLARKMDVNYEYLSEETRVLPFRWMSLEALKNEKFTVKGDIWSFGILIWEMFERGCRPYKNLNIGILLDFIDAGGRLHHPCQCPNDLYEIMKKCWNKIPEERPTFKMLLMEIKNVFDELKTIEPETLETLVEIHEYENENKKYS